MEAWHAKRWGERLCARPPALIWASHPGYLGLLAAFAIPSFQDLPGPQFFQLFNGHSSNMRITSTRRCKPRNKNISLFFYTPTVSPAQDLACHITGASEPPGKMYSPHFKHETNRGSEELPQATALGTRLHSRSFNPTGQPLQTG